MPSVGRSIDRVVGTLSHLLHVRAVRTNTVEDLGPYLGASASVLFPSPVVPRDVTRRRSRIPLHGDRVTETLRWHSQHVPLCPHYRSRHAGEYARNQTVTARWIHPRSGPRRRALVYVHGWLEPGPWVEEAVLLPRLYEALGVDVLHVQLPFHGSRNPKSALFHGEFFWSADLVRSFEAVRQSCIDARTLIAWLRHEGYTEVGVTGISLGGSITMLLACLESVPDYIVPIVAHLQLAEAVEDAPILWRMKADLERFGIDRERRRQIFRQLGLEDMKPVLPAAQQLWIEARDDVYIAAPLVEQQWRAWGQPPIVWIPGGHMTFPLSLARIVASTREFHANLGSGDAR
jgi:pimeloyl-ACP methyl ester carboxylesterase